MTPRTLPRRSRRRGPIVAGLVTGGLAVTGLAVAEATAAGSGTPATTVAATSAAPARSADGFAWFTASSTPLGWRTVDLPGHQAVLSYPPTAQPIHADPGAAAVAMLSPSGSIVTYLNATPQQGDETLVNWPRFRIEHQREDATSSVRLIAATSGLAFQGGRGSCVEDAYTTTVGSHHYREIACLVSGHHGASVVVAATLAADWSRQAPTLEQAVDSYATQ